MEKNTQKSKQNLMKLVGRKKWCKHIFNAAQKSEFQLKNTHLLIRFHNWTVEQIKHNAIFNKQYLSGDLESI